MKHALWALGLTLLIASPARADEWQQVSPAGQIPAARSGHSLVAIDGDIYLYGGAAFDSTTSAGASGADRRRAVLLNNLSKYDVVKNEWQEEEPANEAPPARSGHAAVVVDKKMLVFFGQDASGPRDDIWSYNPATKRWEQLPSTGDSTPAARAGHGAAVAGGKVWIFGGQGADSSQSFSDLWAYDPATGAWESKMTGPSARTMAALAATDAGLICFGGMDTAYRDDLWIYNTGRDYWERIEPQGDWPAARSGMVAAGYGSRLWLASGYGQVGGQYQELTDTWEFDAESQTWIKTADGPKMGSGAAAALIAAAQAGRRRFICFGGTTNFTPHNQTWQCSATEDPCPAAQALGADNPGLASLRAFRDRTLRQSVIGRGIITIYYRHAGTVSAALERSPALRAAARQVFKMAAALAKRYGLSKQTYQTGATP